MEPTRIIYLEAENVKRIKAIRMNPDKTLVKIEGKNAQGKTSVLDAIAAGLGGGDWNPVKAVRAGEKKAKVIIDLGSIKVERRWTAAGGTSLEVTSSDGTIQKSPQAILDRLVGDLTFDPLAFTKMKDKDQADVLKRLAGLDLDPLQNERKAIFEERTIANRRAKDAEARVGTMPPKPKQETPVVVADLLREQQAANRHNSEIDSLAANLQRADQEFAREADNTKSLRASMQSEIDRLVAKLAAFEDDQKAKLSRLRTSAETMRTELGARTKIDSDKFSTAIAEAESINRAIIDRSAYESRAAEAKQLQTVADEMTAKIEEIDSKIERAIRDAKYPLEGLSVDVSGVLFNGIPLSQASAAEQLRIGVAIGLAQKPTCRVMLCRDGSLLDSDSMLLLAKIAEEHDAQVFVERVADTASPSAVFIEDGEIVEATNGN